MVSHPITEYAVAPSHRHGNTESRPKQWRTTDSGDGVSTPAREDIALIDTAVCPLVARSLSSQVKLTTYPSYSNVVKMRRLILPFPPFVLVLRCHVKHHCPPSPNTICRLDVVASFFDILQKLHVFTKICFLTEWATFILLSFVVPPALSFSRKSMILNLN